MSNLPVMERPKVLAIQGDYTQLASKKILVNEQLKFRTSIWNNYCTRKEKQNHSLIELPECIIIICQETLELSYLAIKRHSHKIAWDSTKR